MTEKFDRAYVLLITLKHMRKAVDVSIRKTFQRSKEFEGTEKAEEIFETINILLNMREALDKWQEVHQDILKRKDN